MALKQAQLNQTQQELTKVSGEKDKIKAEVQMLRKSQKAIRGGDLVNQLADEKKELESRLSEQIDERRKEIEFWVGERAQMRDRIEELESLAREHMQPGLIGKSYKTPQAEVEGDN